MAWSLTDKSSLVTITGLDLIATITGLGSGAVRGVEDISGGKFYWETTLTTKPTGGSETGIGKSTATLADYIGADANGWGWYSGDGKIYNNAASVFSGTSFTTNDILGHAFDGPAGKYYTSKNGTYDNSGNPAAGTGAVVTGLTSGPYYPMVSDASGDNDTTVWTANFGENAFNTAPPSGFFPIFRRVPVLVSRLTAVKRAATI